MNKKNNTIEKYCKKKPTKEISKKNKKKPNINKKKEIYDDDDSFIKEMEKELESSTEEEKKSNNEKDSGMFEKLSEWFRERLCKKNFDVLKKFQSFESFTNDSFDKIGKKENEQVLMPKIIEDVTNDLTTIVIIKLMEKYEEHSVYKKIYNDLLQVFYDKSRNLNRKYNYREFEYFFKSGLTKKRKPGKIKNEMSEEEIIDISRIIYILHNAYDIYFDRKIEKEKRKFVYRFNKFFKDASEYKNNLIEKYNLSDEING